MTESAGVTVIETEEINCPLCNEVNYDVVITAVDPQWGIPGEFQVVACRACHHRYMNPAPIASSLADCYPANYGPHQNWPAVEQPAQAGQESKKAADERPWYLKWLPLKKVPGLRRFFIWLLDDKSQVFPNATGSRTSDNFGSRIADAQSRRHADHGELDSASGSVAAPKAFELGCAAGAYLQQLQALGWNVQGLEPSAEAANVAVKAGLKVDQGTLNDHCYESNAYQWIALWMVLEHVPDPRATLAELFRMMASGGTLVLSVPNANCWEPFVFGRHWDAWDLPRHLHHFGPFTIRRLLQECGYSDIRIQHQRSLLNVIGSIGVCLSDVLPNSRMAAWFRHYPHQPRLWFQLLTAPAAQLLGIVKQGGRLTITATKY